MTLLLRRLPYTELCELVVHVDIVLDVLDDVDDALVYDVITTSSALYRAV